MLCLLSAKKLQIKTYLYNELNEKKNTFHYIVFYLFKYLPHQNFSRDFELQILLKISFFR